MIFGAEAGRLTLRRSGGSLPRTIRFRSASLSPIFGMTERNSEELETSSSDTATSWRKKRRTSRPLRPSSALFFQQEIEKKEPALVLWDTSGASPPARK